MPSRKSAYLFAGQSRPLREIAAMTGIYPRTLLYRHRKGESMDEAATRPVGKPGRVAAAKWRANAQPR